MNDASLMRNGGIKPADGPPNATAAVAYDAYAGDSCLLQPTEVFIDLFSPFSVSIAPPLDAFEIPVPVDKQTPLSAKPCRIDDEVASVIWCRNRQWWAFQKLSSDAKNGFTA